MAEKTHRAKCFLSVFLVIFFVLSISVPASAEGQLLVDLEVINGEMDKFANFIHSYDVYLNEGEYFLDVVTVTADETCTVEISGADYIAPDSRTIVSVYVYDPNGNSEQYQLYVYSGSAIPGEHLRTGLQFIDCLNGVIAPAYGQNVQTYYIVLENKYSHADLNIRTFNNDSEVVLEGNKDLAEGKRTKLELKIIESTGETRSYNLYIYRKAKYTAPVAYSRILSNLEVNSGAVDINFGSNTYYYIATVPKSITTLDIQAVAQNRSNIVRVFGPVQMFKNHPTVINVIVSSENDDVISVYTLVLRYESFFNLEKYTDFQLTVMIIAAALISSVFTAFLIDIIKKRQHPPENDIPEHSVKIRRRRPLYIRRKCSKGRYYRIYVVTVDKDGSAETNMKNSAKE